MLVKGAKPYNETVRAIKDLMGPAELGNKIHFVKSRNAELIIRFETSEEMVEELARVPEKLFFLGPDVIKNVVILGRLDRVIILDIDPSTNEEEVLLALRAATPKKLRAMIKVSALWQTTSGHMKALASVPRGVFSARNRLKIGYFLCRLKINAPLPPPDASGATISGTLARTAKGPNSEAPVADMRGSKKPTCIPMERKGA